MFGEDQNDFDVNKRQGLRTGTTTKSEKKMLYQLSSLNIQH